MSDDPEILRREALAKAKKRGHRMTDWVYGAAFLSPDMWKSRCVLCGSVAFVRNGGEEFTAQGTALTRKCR